MTAADLERLDELAADTKDLRAELSRLRNASVVSAVNYSGTGVGSGTGDPVAEAACSMEDVNQQITDNLVEMGDIINTIRPEDLRELFRRIYIHWQSWPQIANEMPRYSGDWKAPQRRWKRVHDRLGVKTPRFWRFR